MENPDFILFTDSSYLRGPHGKYQPGYAVIPPMSILENGPLHNTYSAQQAELIALTRACQLAKEKSTNIYTDSRYAFGVTHDFGMLWKQRGFLTSSGQRIKSGRQVAELLDAILLPCALAIIKISGHSKADTTEAKGNSLADQAAKDSSSAKNKTVN
nr:ribonuclease H-like [Delphinus delphis]